jgi:hypothetical protein
MYYALWWDSTLWQEICTFGEQKPTTTYSASLLLTSAPLFGIGLAFEESKIQYLNIQIQPLPH